MIDSIIAIGASTIAGIIASLLSKYLRDRFKDRKHIYKIKINKETIGEVNTKNLSNFEIENLINKIIENYKVEGEKPNE